MRIFGIYKDKTSLLPEGPPKPLRVLRVLRGKKMPFVVKKVFKDIL